MKIAAKKIENEFHVIEIGLHMLNPKMSTCEVINKSLWHLPVDWKIKVTGNVLLGRKVLIGFPQSENLPGWPWQEEKTTYLSGRVRIDYKKTSGKPPFLGGEFLEEKIVFEIRIGKSKTIFQVITDSPARKFNC